MLKLSNIIAFVYWTCCCCFCCVFPTPVKAKHVSVNNIVASNIQSYMDTTARPCENFYQYACGSWAQQQSGGGAMLDFGDTLGLLDYELNKKLDHIIKRLGNESNTQNDATDMRSFGGNSSVYQKVRQYYKSCKKVKPYNLKKYIQLIPPGFNSTWAILQRHGGRNWNASRFSWLETVAKLRLYGLNGVLLKEEVLPRWDEANSNSIYLDKPNLGETEPLGEGVMIELMLDIGQTKREANRISREVTEFEERLHKLQEIEDEEGAKEMQLGYLQEYMQEIDWLSYIRQLKGVETNLATTVIIQNVPYMRQLVKLLQRTPRETQCHYIMLKFLLFLKQQGPAEISKVECVASLRRAMPLAMSHIIGEHIYRDATLNDQVVQQIFLHLKEKFHETLSDNRLQLERPIVEVLLGKITAMRLQIGNAPRNETLDYFDEFYGRVELDANNFYVNQLSLLRLAVEKSHESLDVVSTNTSDTYILHDWIGSSSSPLYVKPHNIIIVPYGFLQMPVFQRQLHDIYKYSVLGFIIAHELLHGFDSSGIDYDSVGNIMGPSEEITANQRFMHGLRCMQSELATGSRSLNEKLADYEGFRLAYDTYFRGNFSKQQQLGLALVPQLTHKQLFFVSFAQFFCGAVHPQLNVRSPFMEHALDELRVLQTLANFEDFSREFSCERRAKMHSRNRCRLW